MPQLSSAWLLSYFEITHDSHVVLNLLNENIQVMTMVVCQVNMEHYTGYTPQKQHTYYASGSIKIMQFNLLLNIQLDRGSD